MKHKKNILQRGQGLVEYALLLMLVSVSAILALEIFGETVQAEYCKILNGLGTTEDFCPASSGGPADDGDEGETGDPGTANDPGNGGGASDPGNGENNGNTGDEGSPGNNGNGGEQGGDSGDEGANNENNNDDSSDGNHQGDEGNNEPPQDEPKPGTLSITKINTNKPNTKIKFDVRYNGGYEPNVLVHAYFDGKSLYVPKHESGKYYSIKNYVDVSGLPLPITIKATDANGNLLATLDCVIEEGQNGNGTYCSG